MSLVSSAAVGRPLVSIGLPVYNGERFLPQAIDSLLGQTCRDIELIISDNASTDATQEICESYARRDSRVRYFRQPVNFGAPRNWNFVAAQARGTYMKWASANDFCDRAAVSICVAVLEANPSAVLCFGRTTLVDEETGAMRPFDEDLALMEDSPSARLANLFMHLKLSNAMSGVIRMSELCNSELIRFYPAGDLVLLTELALAGKFVLLPQRLLFRRIGKTSLSALLSNDELSCFLDPQARAARSSQWLRRCFDCLMVVLRASISFADRRHSLAMVLRLLYWRLRSSPHRRMQ